ncbi:hypothetical protein [Glutamicibacter ardleyensis]|uniref:hypothetical protein n=1 Tax=Glutamicibacter ardleyensis TaxID=225894 RepID=UPI003FD5BBC4
MNVAGTERSRQRCGPATGPQHPYAPGGLAARRSVASVELMHQRRNLYGIVWIAERGSPHPGIHTVRMNRREQTHRFGNLFAPNSKAEESRRYRF